MSNAFRSVTAAALAAALTACGDGPTSPRETPSSEADELLAGLSRAGLTTAYVTSGPISIATLSGSPCTYADGRYTCPAVTNAGISITRSFAFYDAAGAPQQRYDPLTTASVWNAVTLEGTVTTPRGTAEIDRAFTQTASGLLGKETRRIVDGTGAGSTTVTLTTANGTTTITTASYDTTRALVLPVPTAPPAYPLGGSITTVMRYALTGAGLPAGAQFPASEVRVKMTFDGTSVASLDVSVGGLTQHCTLNMAPASSGALSCPTGLWLFGR